MDRGDHQPHRHADIHERGLGQLQAGFNRLGNGVAGAQLIEPRGVRGIAGARNDREVGSLLARNLDDSLGGFGRIHGDDQRAGGAKAAAAQKIYARGVAPINIAAELAAILAQTAHKARIAVDGQSRNFVADQHIPHQRADAAIADDDHMVAHTSARSRLQRAVVGGPGLRFGLPCAGPGQPGNSDHRQRRRQHQLPGEPRRNDSPQSRSAQHHEG